MPSGIYKRITGQAGQIRLEMLDQRFERLLVLSYDESVSKQGVDSYLVRCDCGIEKVVRGASLRSGNTKSCGCLNIERSRKWCQELGKRLYKQLGENTSNYCHGYYTARREFREKVRERDVACQHDGEHKGRLEVHHIDGDDYNNILENGILLCSSHHTVVTNGGNVWRPELCLSL